MKTDFVETFEANTERIERAKKLYRYISDAVRRVSEATASCSTLAELFTNHMEIQRQKLRDNCEKLIFLDPIHYGKKSLELMWRKVYYEPVSVGKKLRESCTQHDSYLFTHITCGIGHFHHFIARIQLELNLHFKELDYMSLHLDEEMDRTDKNPSEDIIMFGRYAAHLCIIYLGDLCRYQVEIFHSTEPSVAARYYLQAAQLDMSSGMPHNQLGNLYMDRNYNLDSVYYYIHCLSCNMPFDGALGNLTKIFIKNTQIAETLRASESLTQSEHIHMMVANFFTLIETWYFNKGDTNIPELCSMIAQDFKIAIDFDITPLPDINKSYDEYMHGIEDENMNPSYLNSNLVHKMVLICLFTVNKVSEVDETKVFAVKAFTLALLAQLLQKLLAQLEKLGLKNPAIKYRKTEAKEIHGENNNPNDENQVNIAPLSNGTHVDKDNECQIAVDKVVKDNGEEKSATKKLLAKRRRRRRASSLESSEGSDIDTDVTSDEDDDLSDATDQSDSVVSESEDELKTDSSYDGSDTEDTKEEMEEIKKTDIIENKMNGEENLNEDLAEPENKDHCNEQEIQNFLLGNNYLTSIKLLQDWVLLEKDLILSCGDSGGALFQCVVDLLNIFTVYFNAKAKRNNHQEHECNVLNVAIKIAKKLQLEYRTIPLPEDINLRGTNICKYDKDAAEWQILEKFQPSIYEENVIRILNFLDFGDQIAKIVPQIKYNRNIKLFYWKKTASPKLTTKINHKKNREWHNSKKQYAEGKESGLLRRLGRLWLTARVAELEGNNPVTSPSLLALDASALHRHLRRVKQLSRVPYIIFLIPQVVLQELDQLKREHSGARDAIRWLEGQLRGGAKSVRAQRPGQARTLPLLKYPRKPHPRLHYYIQILEFCYYFLEDEKRARGADGDNTHIKGTPILTLITGNKHFDEEHFKEFSISGTAQAAGISLQHIDEFYLKWRQTAHRSGKKR